MKTTLYIVAGVIVFLGLMALHMYIITEDEYLVYETAGQDPSVPSIEIQGTSLHAETFGMDTAEVVIILHDGPGKDFRSLLPLKRLANNYFIVFYDQRGSGLSNREDEKSLNMDQMIEDLHEVINYYSDSGAVNLIGHSWGGLLASAYVAKYPLRAKKLIIVEPWDYSPEIPSENKFNYMQQNIRFWFESRHVKGPDKHASLDYYFAQLEHASDFHPGGRHYMETKDSIEKAYWRYGALAKKKITESILNEEGQIRLLYFDGIDSFENDILIIAEEKEKPGIQIMLLSTSMKQCNYEPVQTAFAIDSDKYIDIIQAFLDNRYLILLDK